MAPTARASVAFLIVSLIHGLATAGSSVTVSEAVRLFLAESPQARRVPLIEESVRAERLGDALFPNPEVAYQIEDAADVRDEFLTVQQEFPITGRRGLVRDSAAAASTAAYLEAQQELRVSASVVRDSFYEVLYRERVTDRLRHGAEQLERIVDIVAEREREGEGSGYDLLRAEQELTQVEIAASEAEAMLVAARSRFGGFFDPDRSMEDALLEGDLQPAGVLPEASEAIERAVSERSDLAAIRAEALGFDSERRAARRRRFPTPTLTAGWKRTEAPGLDDTGFVAALAVPVPVFHGGKLAEVRAGADKRRAELDLEIREREIRARVRAALARERAARRTAQMHGEDVERRAVELRTIAELAYDEGETGILELLDAYRTSLATELRALAVRYEARRAEIERDRAIGAEVKP